MSQSPISVIQKIPEFFSTWFAMLMGKPRSSLAKPETLQVESANNTIPDPDDPVARDVAVAREASKKVISAIEEKIKPIVEKEKFATTNTLPNVIVMSKSLLTTINIKKVGVGLFMIIIIFFALSTLPGMIAKVQKGQLSVDVNTSSTPTPAEFKSTQPSVYANDKTILKLEENLNILDKQINSTNIRESTLTPPELDFSIKFN